MMWTNNHASQAGSPVKCTSFKSATALFRPMVADHLHFRMIGNRQVVVNNHPADTICWHAERMTDERCGVAGRPDFHTARNEFVSDLETLLGKIGRVNSRAHFDAKIDK